MKGGDPVGNGRETEVMRALQEVKDPEIPAVSILELGMVNQATVTGHHVRVEVTPTFVGCPALDWIHGQIVEHLKKIPGIEEVEVVFVIDPPWTSDRITLEGRRKLESFGIAPPPKTEDPDPLNTVPRCPYCGADQGEVKNLFGPTACRSIYYCKHCRQPFEGMKAV
ncbi:1,2-phenylacetyl-CoA epoxidase subunit PaaD [Marinithermofilum abyssi]|uniref:1,2-phenylacetyl-CoA epoxidase subunit PaaD n=1 Tax=Marinithermofilum abyssi TaxID=1571185 RepID=UPI001665421B